MTPATSDELRLAFEAEIAKLSEDDQVVWMRFAADSVVEDHISAEIGSDSYADHSYDYEDVGLEIAAERVIHHLRELFGATQPPAAHQSHRTGSSA